MIYFEPSYSHLFEFSVSNLTTYLFQFLISFVSGYFIYTFFIGFAVYLAIAIFSKDKKFRKLGFWITLVATFLGFALRILLLSK